MKHLQELRSDIRFGLGEIVPLPNILFQIEELHAPVFVVFEQLVLPQTDRPPGTLVPVIAVMGKVPVDGAPVMSLTPKGGQETDSVDMLLRARWASPSFRAKSGSNPFP